MTEVLLTGTLSLNSTKQISTFFIHSLENIEVDLAPCKTCEKRPLSKRPKIGFEDQL